MEKEQRSLGQKIGSRECFENRTSVLLKLLFILFSSSIYCQLEHYPEFEMLGKFVGCIDYSSTR